MTDTHDLNFAIFTQIDKLSLLLLLLLFFMFLIRVFLVYRIIFQTSARDVTCTNKYQDRLSQSFPNKSCKSRIQGKPVFWVSDKVRHKPDCTLTLNGNILKKRIEADQHLRKNCFSHDAAR